MLVAAVAGAILRGRQNFQSPLLLDMVGVPDCFDVSGKPWELMQYLGLCAEHIAERIVRLYEKRASAKRLAA